MNNGSAGLDLGAATLKDLTGGDSDIYGDLLSPGRLGEELDWLAVSDSGDYVAVVRDMMTGGSTYYCTYHSYGDSYSSSFSSWYANHDMLVISTQGIDMDSGSSGTQHVLYVGSDSYGQGSSGNPGGMPPAGRTSTRASGA
jgi:hypothetical protein